MADKTSDVQETPMDEINREGASMEMPMDPVQDTSVKEIEDISAIPQQPPSMAIDHINDYYPFCIVWSSIPVITWMFPFFGHVGIGTSEGIIRDFACSKHVCENSFAYGSPVKYWQLKYHQAVGWERGWNSAIEEAAEIYSEREHRDCWDNCYSFVCQALNIMKYEGKTNWCAFNLIPRLCWNSKYVSKKRCCMSWMPITIIYCFMAMIVFMIYDAIVNTVPTGDADDDYNDE
ncbi:hypothetical protein C0J52_16498 [Blattella germanica]|nr:hypothetical protein C0J52_16498 [Blattella germanica]